MTEKIKLLCCYDGKLVVEGDGVAPTYVGGIQKPIKVDRSSTLEDVRRKIFEATKIDPLAYSLVLTCKYPIHGGAYRAVALTNDEIVDCMLDESSVGGAIELYVEKDIILRKTGNGIHIVSSTVTIDECVETTRDMLIDKPDADHGTGTQGFYMGGWDFSLTRLASTNTSESIETQQATYPSLNREESVTEKAPCILEATTGNSGVAIASPLVQNDPFLLHKSINNVSKKPSEREGGMPRKCYHMLSMRDWPLTHPIMIDQLNQAGFLVANSLQWLHLDMHLLCAVIERWHPETNTFHLHNVEISLTLQDVAVLTGLVVDGLPVTAARDVGGLESRWATWTDCCNELLGRAPMDIIDSAAKLKLAWLRDNFKDVPENATAETVAYHTRAYIMHMLGSWIVPNRSGNAVPCRYLPLLEDFEKCGRTAFGAASLAYLYRELSRASRESVKRLAGNIHLLQLWAWEHLKVGRPIMQEGDYGGGPYPGPLGIRWQGERRHRRPMGHLMFYRRELNLADGRWVIWEPYPKNLLDRLPAICTAGKGVWQSRAPLIHFDIVEMHFPDRVMRQFGMKQHLPKPVESIEQINARRKPGANWLEQHYAYLARWAQRHLLVVKEEEHQSELSNNNGNDEENEKHEEAACQLQGHMGKDLIHLVNRLHTQLNDHLLECEKPCLLYKMLAEIEHTYGVHGLHHLLGPLPSSPLSQPAPPESSVLSGIQMQNGQQKEELQSPLPSASKGNASFDESLGKPLLMLFARSPMRQGKSRGRKRGSIRAR
ncbi:hypothetical protein M5K25_018183 [Dendrobium thyrsiflorum]|uniref:Aminotransferase-like plant mobile domain-containing protein n=1 Tax=Dendrobium thyrsiflorum TaxID=117978 RepID=A0ABD0UPH8_DENTH